MRVLRYGNINDIPGFLANNQPKWHRVAYDMWDKMWARVYSDLKYFGVTIQPKYKFLSGYIEDFQKLENFEKFKENPYGWCIDKDIKGGTHIGYYFDFLSLTTKDKNNKERNNRCGLPKKKFKPIMAYGDKILLFTSIKEAIEKGYNAGNIIRCLKGERKSHKGLRWFRINYNSTKIYRVKEI